MIPMNGHNLPIEDLWRVAPLQATCELSGQARPRIRRRRELAEPLAAQPRALYGIHEGCGPLSGYRVSGEALAVHEAPWVLHWMELLTACLFQALGGEPEVLCEQAHKARGFRGQSLVARRISDSLRTHPAFALRIDEHQWGSQAKPVDPGAEV